MSILIKGVEMPREKKTTLTIFPDGRVYENHGERLWGHGEDCIPWKAVPVPPHGRLIDADALKKNAYPFPCAIGTEWAVTLRQINDAPTIIPASEEGGE